MIGVSSQIMKIVAQVNEKESDGPIGPLLCRNSVGMHQADNYTRLSYFPAQSALAWYIAFATCKPRGMLVCWSMNHRIVHSIKLLTSTLDLVTFQYNLR